MFAVVVVTYAAPAAVLDATLAALRSTLDASSASDGGDSASVGADRRDDEEVPIIVVDTGGHADVSGTNVELVRVSNRGYGAAANIGFARARELGATDFVLLNDDVIVRAGWLDALAAELGGRVGAVQPKLLIAASGRINSLGVELDRAGAGRDIGYDAADDDPNGQAAAHDIEIFTGGAVLFSGAFLDETGGFDERFMLYYEDVDLALRGRELGWRYRLVPAAVVEHIGGMSTSSEPARTRYLQERNRLWNAARHASASAMANAVWLSVRRLRYRPLGVHSRALVAGLAAMPQRRLERHRAQRRAGERSKLS